MSAVPRVYIFYGDDHASRQVYLERLRQRFEQQSGDWAAFNYQHLRGDVHSLSDLATAVQTPPVFVPRRLVLVTDPLPWAQDAAGRKRLLAILDEVPDSTALALDIPQMLEMSRKRRDRPHWLLAWAQRRGPQWVYLKALPAPKNIESMAQWLMRAAREVQAPLQPAAAQALAAAIGVDTQRGLQELRKLALYADGRPITPDDVAALVAGEWTPDLFRWLDLIGAGQTRAAWQALQRMTEQQDPAFLWNMLLRHFRLLLALRDAMDHGVSSREFARQWNIPSFAINRYKQQAGRFTTAALRDWYRVLYELEARYRRHELTLDEALEAVLTRLTLAHREAP